MALVIMGKLRTLAFLIACCITLTGLAQQNLVPNHSFEDYKRCPQQITSSAYRFPLKNWYVPSKATTDYFNSCANVVTVSTPKNSLGYQNSRTGNGYIGIANRPKWREYVQVEFKMALEKGNQYHVEFWVSLAEISGRATTSLGVHFSNTKVVDLTTFSALPLIPQIQFSDSILNDTIQWVKIGGKFLANGGEQFLTIGLFPKSGLEWEKRNVQTNSLYRHVAYYFIDDVCVTEIGAIDACRCETEENSIADANSISTLETESKKSLFAPGAIITLPDITFSLNQWELKDIAKPTLDSLALYLNAHLPYQLRIDGHTDDSGNAITNQTLSEKRAQAVKAYLVSKGIAEERISIKVYGSTQPIAENTTEAGKAQNRRVELMIDE